MNRSGDIPFLSSKIFIRASVRGGRQFFFQAGLLTLGSSFLPRLPVHFLNSGILRLTVPDHSEGLVPGFHGIPY